MTSRVSTMAKETLAAVLDGRRKLVAIAVLAIAAAALVVLSFGTGEPEPVGGPAMMRRLTESQYRATIADIFGPDIPIVARFEKPVRADGLIAIGTGRSGMSAFAVEQYDGAAQAIAQAVFNKKNRSRFLHCGPKDDRTFDEGCARAFLKEKGRLLFRRPLTKAQADKYVALARSAHGQLGSFHDGLELSLYTMLVSPDFLLRIERTAPAREGTSAQLDAYSKASRLSYFLTNSTPDDELLRAAEAGDLDSSRGLALQVDRLMASPGYEQSLRAFFADMLQFERFDDLSKDPEIYPAFNSEVAADAKEQTLRTIVDLLITRDGDYRDLFTTRDTFLTRSLGVIYQTPVVPRTGWEAVTFTPDSDRSGIQSQISFLALHSHPGRSSPTLRGYGVREVFLCQQVPDPPPNVNFTAVEENAHARNVTARDRLKIHATEPACAGCHKVMDPLGLAMENYDGLGRFRTRENGALIDTAGSLDGTDFHTPGGLAQALHDHPEAPRCVAERLYNTAVGRDITWDERYYLDWLIEGFADHGYRVPDLMRQIVMSRNFFTVSRPRAANPTIVNRTTGTGAET